MHERKQNGKGCYFGKLSSVGKLFRTLHPAWLHFNQRAAKIVKARLISLPPEQRIRKKKMEAWGGGVTGSCKLFPLSKRLPETGQVLPQISLKIRKKNFSERKSRQMEKKTTTPFIVKV